MVDFITISKKLTIICLVCLVIFLLNLIVLHRVLHVKSTYAHNDYLVSINEKIPKFNLPLLNNPQLLVDQDILQNKLTLISVWSTDCRFCKQEHKTLLNIASYLKGKEINFVGINCKNHHAQATQWLHSHGDPYVINLFDQRGTLIADLKSTSLPDLFIIDNYNKVRYRYSGVVTQKVWENDIKPIVERLYLHTNK